MQSILYIHLPNKTTIIIAIKYVKQGRTARLTRALAAALKTTNSKISASSELKVELTRSSADADNRLDAFSGQSRSTNMVPFHVLHMVSYCAIVTLSLRHAVFTIFVFKKSS